MSTVQRRTLLTAQVHQLRNFIEQCNCGIVIALVFADKGYYLFGCRSGVVRGKGDSEWRVTGECATLFRSSFGCCYASSSMRWSVWQPFFFYRCKSHSRL